MHWTVASILIISLPMTIGIQQTMRAGELQNVEAILSGETENFLLAALSLVLILVLVMFYHNRRRSLMTRILSQKQQEIENSKIREREKNRKIRAIQEMVEIQEAEMINIAKDLQDSLGGLLS